MCVWGGKVLIVYVLLLCVCVHMCWFVKVHLSVTAFHNYDTFLSRLSNKCLLNDRDIY